MRSTAILSLYCCFFASLVSVLVSILGAIFVPSTGLGYFFASIFLFFPLIPVHATLIHILRHMKYSKENIKWSMSAILWMALLVACTLLSPHEYCTAMPFVIAIGISQSFGYVKTFSLQPPLSKNVSNEQGMYSAV